MQYPLISEYLAAIQDAHDNLDKLNHLVPVLDKHGEPYRSSGAFAVVFKMKDEQTGKCYALKCFTEEQEGRAEAYRQIGGSCEPQCQYWRWQVCDSGIRKIRRK